MKLITQKHVKQIERLTALHAKVAGAIDDLMDDLENRAGKMEDQISELEEQQEDCPDDNELRFTRICNDIAALEEGLNLAEDVETFIACAQNSNDDLGMNLEDATDAAADSIK